MVSGEDLPFDEMVQPTLILDPTMMLGLKPACVIQNIPLGPAP
jgi:hypothetical protein